MLDIAPFSPRRGLRIDGQHDLMHLEYRPSRTALAKVGGNDPSGWSLTTS